MTGTLRAAGLQVTVDPVGVCALVNGADASLQSVIAVEAALVADTRDFAPKATVADALKIHAEAPTSIKLPDTVAPTACVRIEKRAWHDKDEWPEKMPNKLFSGRSS